MKLLFVINQLSRGGTEMMLLRLLRAPVFANDEIMIVSIMSRGDLASEFESLGHKIVYLGATGSPLGFLRMLRLGSVMRKFDPDLVHSRLYISDLLSGLAASVSGVKCLVWSLTQSNLTPQVNKRSTLFCMKLCAATSSFLPTSIIANSVTSKNNHVAEGYPEDKIEVIPNGIDASIFFPDPNAGSSIRSSLGIGKTQKVVGIFGRYDPQKNHLGFISAARKIRDQVPGTVFLMAGLGVDESNTALVEKIKRNGLSEACKLLGVRNDIPNLINAIDLLALSSHGEGWPNVIGEAMACGKPCVATNVGDVVQILGRDGRIVDVGDMEAFAVAAIETLRMSGRDIAHLADRLRSRVLSDFEICSIAERYRGFYKKVIAQKKG